MGGYAIPDAAAPRAAAVLTGGMLLALALNRRAQGLHTPEDLT
jgi:hypothetical protein